MAINMHHLSQSCDLCTTPVKLSLHTLPERLSLAIHSLTPAALCSRELPCRLTAAYTILVLVPQKFKPLWIPHQCCRPCILPLIRVPFPNFDTSSCSRRIKHPPSNNYPCRCILQDPDPFFKPSDPILHLCKLRPLKGLNLVCCFRCSP